jgi:uncharacterized protein (DUF3084 family)
LKDIEDEKDKASKELNILDKARKDLEKENKNCGGNDVKDWQLKFNKLQNDLDSIKNELKDLKDQKNQF